MARSLRVFALAVMVTAVGTVSGVVATAAPTGGPAGHGAAPAVAAPAPAVSLPIPAPPAPATPAPAAPAPPLPQAAPPAPTAPCAPNVRACVQLSTNQAWLLIAGAVSYGPVPIRHGQAGWRTPPGTFKVGVKSKYHRSRLFDLAPMPNSVFFNGGIAFHAGSLRSQSHGCIRLSQQASLVFFTVLQRGDVVQVVR